MADKEKKKEVAETESKDVTIYNRGQRTYVTSRGEFSPGKSIDLPEKEAKMLLDYSDVVDASKMAPKSPNLGVLKADNDSLKKELAAAKAKIEDLEAQLAKKK